MDKLAIALKKARSVALISHISPDGDTLGSVMALKLALEKLGKHAFVLPNGALQPELCVLPHKDELCGEPPFEFDTAFAVDCADEGRLGDSIKYFNAANTRLVLDHHGTNTGFGDIFYIDPNAAATGELAFRLIKLLGAEPDRAIAECLYIAIATDTGNFRFSSVTPDTFYCAAELLKYGVDIAGLSSALFSDVSAAKMKLRALCVNKTQFYCGGSLGVALLDKSDYAPLGVDDSDFEGIVNCIRDIKTVELALLFRQTKSGLYKLSARSKTRADCAKLCALFGGGGHIRAAGATVSPSDAQKLIETAKTLI